MHVTGSIASDIDWKGSEFLRVLHFETAPVFYLRDKQGMFMSDECSSLCNRVGDFLLLVYDRRKELFCVNSSACM